MSKQSTTEKARSEEQDQKGKVMIQAVMEVQRSVRGMTSDAIAAARRLGAFSELRFCVTWLGFEGLGRFQLGFAI